MKKFLLAFLFSTIVLAGISAQSHLTKQSHQAVITAIENANDKANPDSFFTASEDGYLIKWNKNGEGEHYQVTNLWIKYISCSPNGTDVAIYETDGASINIVSVWDWKKLTKKFQKKYNDTITTLSYSATGNFLIVGTSSINGAEFLKTSNWQVDNKLKASTNIVNYIWTSDTEKTVAFYSTSGNFSIFDMNSGEQKIKLSYNQGMTNTTMYGSNLFAGVRSNNIYIYNVFTKTKLLATLQANNPLLVSTSNDSELYYVVNNGTGGYTLYSNPISKDMIMASSKEMFTCKIPGFSPVVIAKKIGNYIVYGTKDGSVYKAEISNEKETVDAVAFTTNSYKPVFDVQTCAENQGFYFLTDDAVYKTEYDAKLNICTCSRILATSKEKNFLCYKNNLIFWSNNTLNTVTMVDLETAKKTNLFTPGYHVQNIKLCSDGIKDYLVEIETAGIINIYDFETKKTKQIYSGTGIQDAVMGSDGFLYIAKTASTYPNTPLLQVNIKTHETVPSTLSGNISYSLELSRDKNTIMGIIFKNAENDHNTYVFAYDLNKKQSTEILKFEEEDTEAFTYSYDTKLYTNIGKNLIYSYNLKNRKKVVYKRSASIPKKIIQNGDILMILNNNGSFSVINAKTNKMLMDLYFNAETQTLDKVGGKK